MTMNMRNTLLLALLAVCGAANAVKVSELPTGQKVGNILDETLLVGGGATTAATPTLTIPRTDAGTNVVAYLLRLQRESSGTPAAGIGTGIEFRAETAAGNVETGATIEAVTTDVTATSEDFALVFKTMEGGAAAAERLRISSNGAILASASLAIPHTFNAITSHNINGWFFLEGTSSGGVTFGNGQQVAWVSGSNTTSSVGRDAGLVRNAAAVLRGTDGSTGIGSILSKALVEANTAGSGAPNVLVGNESTTILTNEGATAQNYHTLPTAVAGLVFEFVVQDADGIRVVAATGDTIQDVGTVSATAGYIQSTTIGSVIRLAAINATQWVVMSKQGTWTVDS